MAWTFNSIRIYTQKFESGDINMIARLQPIANGTVLHHFGYQDGILRVSALIATDAALASLKATAKTSSTYALVAPEGAVGSFYVKGVRSSRTNSVNTKLFDQPGLDCDVPMYTVDLELYE